MKTLPVQQLPVGSAGCGDVRLLSDGFDLLVQFEYGGGKQQVGAVKFGNVTRYEFCEEKACREFVPGSLNAVVEIEGSSVLSALGSSAEGKHHFVAFLSGNGRLDVIAKSLEMLSPAKTWHVID